MYYQVYKDATLVPDAHRTLAQTKLDATIHAFPSTIHMGLFNIFCTGSFAPWRAPVSLSTGKPASTREPTNTVVSSGYQDAQPMVLPSSQNESKAQDVTEAETMFGISFFKEYRGFLFWDDKAYLLFSARFQPKPQEIHLVSCPATIHAPKLDRTARYLLQLKLDAARDWVPESHWKFLKIDQRHGLNISECEEG